MMDTKAMVGVIVIVFVLIFGVWYYYAATKGNKQMAFLMKMGLLVMSLVLAFVEKDLIVIGNSLVFGGRVSVMVLIIIEIVDAIVGIQKKR